jgi:flagellar basal body-associated protein FliL
VASSGIEREVRERRGKRGASIFIAVCAAIVLLAVAFFSTYEPTGNTFTPWPRNATVPQPQSEPVERRP